MSTIVRPSCDEGVIQTSRFHKQVSGRVGMWILVATILGSSLSFIDGTVVNVALPTIQRELGATVADVQWIIEAYALFLSALLLVGGSLGDRLGRRRIFSLGIAIFTIASVGCGFAPNTTVLIFARALQGIGGALLVPGSLAIISASFSGQARGQAIGSWSAFTTVTSALGPVLGGWLVQAASWRWVFFINVPLALVTLWITYRFVPESRDEVDSGALDWRGAALATLGLGGVVFGLIEASTLGLGSPVVIISLLIGVAALVAFLVVEIRVQAAGGWPMVPLSLFRSRTFSGANLLTLFLYGGLAGALYFVPFNLQQVQGYTAAEAGAALLPFTATVFLLSRWAGGLVHRVGARLPLIVGPIIVAAGFALYAVPSIGGSYWTTFFPAIVVLSLGMALVIAPLTTTVMNAVATERAGIASGINNTVSRTAGLLAIAVMNLVVVGVFDRALSRRLSSVPLSDAARAAIEAQRSHLAAAQLPAGLSPQLQDAAQHALDMAFVDGFRVAMLLAAGLALLSAVAAALLIEGREATEPGRHGAESSTAAQS
jgi:EmrB/QacA subfamily drug resistance transporter